MSRLKKFTRSLLSGYLLLGTNVIYTLASIPLALHYLSNEEFGLWAVITQVANLKLMLVDFGMAGSISRILIDHKDDPSSKKYGAVIKTGFLVLFVQGVVIAIAGSIISFWLPGWMNLQAGFWHIFRWLLIGESVLLGVTFAGRMATFILLAHQRYDISNYSSIASLAVNFAVLWLGFKWGMGLYSLLLSFAASLLCGMAYNWFEVCRLGLLPENENRGRANLVMFKELFFYGTDVFLMTIGNQLIFASQTLVITRVLGLEAAAVWSVASKIFMLAQQVVFRISDFASGAFAEMMVRGEQDKLKSRFQDIAIITGSASVAVYLAVALCNGSFLEIWTHDRIFWSVKNDFIFALMMIVYSNTRCHTGLAVLTKRIRAMKYIYFFEGVSFVVCSILLAKQFGLIGIMFSAIFTDLLCVGIYGIRRSMQYFQIPAKEILFNWYKSPLQFLWAMLAATLLIWLATHSLNTLAQLLIDGVCISIVGFYLFWRLGLSQKLRDEAEKILMRLTERFAAGKYLLNLMRK